MPSAEPPEQHVGILYVDTSALLKLLVREAESTAIERELVQWPNLATSIVTEVELPRAVARAREDRPDAVIDGSLILQGVVASAAIIELSDGIVAVARGVAPVHVGALDAIHIASALASMKNSPVWQRMTSVWQTPSLALVSACSPLGSKPLAGVARAAAAASGLSFKQHPRRTSSRAHWPRSGDWAQTGTTPIAGRKVRVQKGSDRQLPASNIGDSRPVGHKPVFVPKTPDMGTNRPLFRTW